MKKNEDRTALISQPKPKHKFKFDSLGKCAAKSGGLIISVLLLLISSFLFVTILKFHSIDMKIKNSREFQKDLGRYLEEELADLNEKYKELETKIDELQKGKISFFQKET